MNTLIPLWAILVALLSGVVPGTALASSCEDLAALSLPNTTIVLAQSVAAGAVTLPNAPGLMVNGSVAVAQLPPPASLKNVALTDLPAFCRVAIRMKPSQDSDIKAEAWMPGLAGWNGKFMAVGNGGGRDPDNYASLSEPLARGYATASTDTGHEGSNVDGSFAFGHPEKLIDFGDRAVHEMTLKAKTIIAAYYGEAFLLEWLFDGRAAGSEGSTAFPRRF